MQGPSVAGPLYSTAWPQVDQLPSDTLGDRTNDVDRTDLDTDTRRRRCKFILAGVPIQMTWKLSLRPWPQMAPTVGTVRLRTPPSGRPRAVPHEVTTNAIWGSSAVARPPNWPPTGHTTNTIPPSHRQPGTLD